MEQIKEGLSFSQERIVTEKDTAKAYGSGSLAVYATPALIAFMENTALKTIEKYLPESSSTVGIEIHTKHIKATPVGDQITCEAVIAKVEGRMISYEITAKDSKNDIIGTATHDRVVIDVERFMSKL